jgi:hypothetical protein
LDESLYNVSELIKFKHYIEPTTTCSNDAALAAPAATTNPPTTINPKKKKHFIKQLKDYNTITA